MIYVIIIVLSLLIITSAVAAVFMRDIVGAIVTAGVVSLLASVLYLIYGSPDVAMTEASIGSALTTVVFLFAWFRIKHLDRNKKGDKID